MSDNDTPTTEPAPGNGDGGQPRTFSQEDVDRIVKERAERLARQQYGDYDDLKKKAAAFDEAEAAKKSELERMQEQLNAATSEAGQLRIGNLRTQVALSEKLPLELADRLVGTTEDELRADAKKLLEQFPQQQQRAPKPPPSQLQSGGGMNSPTGGVNDWLRRSMGVQTTE